MLVLSEIDGVEVRGHAGALVIIDAICMSIKRN